jgi:hypothetical protein
MIKPILIENLIPITYQNDLEKTLNTIPFYFTPSIGYNEDSPKTDGIKFLDNIGFSHSLIMNNKIDSDYWNLFKPILYFFNEKTGIFVKEVLRVRLRLTVQHPDREQFLFNKPHTDLPDFKNPYKTLIVYLNESDGDTFIFNKFYNEKEPLKNVLENIDKSVILRQKPKKGNGVYFEGHQYHSGNTPINYKARYLINFDFTI